MTGSSLLTRQNSSSNRCLPYGVRIMYVDRRETLDPSSQTSLKVCFFHRDKSTVDLLTISGTFVVSHPMRQVCVHEK
jgi:hypothetical protein